MDSTEKKFNQILNMLNLIHHENTYFLSVVINVIDNQSDKNKLLDYMKNCERAKQVILSGMYEDEINITH